MIVAEGKVDQHDNESNENDNVNEIGEGRRKERVCAGGMCGRRRGSARQRRKISGKISGKLVLPG